jgi:hypothetical protein
MPAAQWFFQRTVDDFVLTFGGCYDRHAKHFHSRYSRNPDRRSSSQYHRYVLRPCIGRISPPGNLSLGFERRVFLTVLPRSHCEATYCKSAPTRRWVALESRMTNLAVKFVSALSAGIVVSAPIAMIPLSTVGAAEECLTTPKNETPPGKHWYYRSEGGTKRLCWYLREEGETPSQTATSTPDAHAELPLPQTLVEADLKISPTTPATSFDPRGAAQKPSNNASRETARPPVASGRPEPTGVFSSPTEGPISPSFVVASPARDPNSDASAETDLAPKVPTVVLTKVETSAMGTPASLRILLLGTFGAIAVLWLTGKAIMARMRRRPQRYTRSKPHTNLNPPEWSTEESTNHTRKPMPVNSTRRRNAGSQSSDRQRTGLGDNAREIEQLLARFAKQAQIEP